MDADLRRRFAVKGKGGHNGRTGSGMIVQRHRPDNSASKIRPGWPKSYHGMPRPGPLAFSQGPMVERFVVLGRKVEQWD